MRVHVSLHLLLTKEVLLADGTLNEPLAILSQAMLYLHVANECLAQIARGGHTAAAESCGRAPATPEHFAAHETDPNAPVSAAAERRVGAGG